MIRNIQLYFHDIGIVYCHLLFHHMLAEANVSVGWWQPISRKALQRCETDGSFTSFMLQSHRVAMNQPHLGFCACPHTMT